MLMDKAFLDRFLQYPGRLHPRLITMAGCSFFRGCGYE